MTLLQLISFCVVFFHLRATMFPKNYFRQLCISLYFSNKWTTFSPSVHRRLIH